MKATKQELLERITKLETLTQELEKKVKDVLDSCQCIELGIEESKFRESEGHYQPLIESDPISVKTAEGICHGNGDDFHSKEG